MNHYDHLLSPVVVFDHDLAIVYFNAAFATFVQLPPRKLRGKNIAEILGVEFALIELTKQCVASGEPIVTGEVKITTGIEPKEVVLKIFPVAWETQAVLIGVNVLDFSIERTLHQKHRMQLDELKQKNEEIKKYSAGLELLVDARTQELRLERDEIDSILRSLTQGLIVVESNLRLSLKASQCATSMLGQDSLHGKLVLDVLFPNLESADIREVRNQFERFMVSAFSLFIPEQFDDLVRFAPKSIKCPDPAHRGRWKTFALNFSSVIQNDAVVKVLIALRDDTELEELRQLGVTVHRKVVEALERVANGRGNVAFERFSSEMGKIVGEINSSIEFLESSEIISVFRSVHTIKGGARVFALNYLSHFAHEAETILESIRSGKEELTSRSREQLKEDLAWLERGVVAVERLVSVGKGDRRSQDDLSIAWRASVEAIKDGFSQLANDLGKCARLSFSSSQPLSDEERAFLEQCLVHLLRNALDHGVELPDVRIAQGKYPEAAVSVRVHDDEDIVSVVVEDDGAGINRYEVRRLAMARGILSSDSGPLTLEQLLEILTHPGFSTQVQVTEVSGRGVGLDAVRSLLQKRGGDLSLSQSSPIGTRFILFWRKQHMSSRAS